MNDAISMLKLTVITALGVIAAYFNVLLIPLVVLTAVMLIDYITGMAGASVTGKLNSRVGVMGIVKTEVYNKTEVYTKAEVEALIQEALGQS